MTPIKSNTVCNYILTERAIASFSNVGYTRLFFWLHSISHAPFHRSCCVPIWFCKILAAHWWHLHCPLLYFAIFWVDSLELPENLWHLYRKTTKLFSYSLSCFLLSTWFSIVESNLLNKILDCIFALSVFKVHSLTCECLRVDKYVVQVDKCILSVRH